MKLYEKYRPKSFDQVIGQSAAVAGIRYVLNRGWGGKAWFIHGPSGAGKTTLARIIAAHGADDWFIEELPMARDISIADLRVMRASMALYATGKGGRAFIINEAHGMRRDVLEGLLTLLEEMPDSACLIFTTTSAGKDRLFDDCEDAGPLLSRCINVELRTLGLAESFGAECQRIAIAENLDGGHDLAAYVALVQSCKLNMRAALQRIEQGAMLEAPAPVMPRAACLAQPEPKAVAAPKVKQWWQQEQSPLLRKAV